MQTACKICNKEFRHKPSAIRQFCSMPCYRNSRRGKFLKPSNFSCLECKKELRIRPRDLLTQKYCSKICWTKNFKPTRGMLGKKHSPESRRKMSVSQTGKTGVLASHWKGGIWRESPKKATDKLERMRFRETIQKRVLERDNYTCQLCLTRGGALQVDHIQSWAEYVDLRFDIKNCRTLCMECHYEITTGKPMPETIKSWGHNLKHITERMVN